MSLSDCPKCWETPCLCGHGYAKWSAKALQSFIVMLNGLVLAKEKPKKKKTNKVVLKTFWVKPFMTPPIETWFTRWPQEISNVPIRGWYRVEEVRIETRSRPGVAR